MLGCGGLMRRFYEAGSEISVLVATHAYTPDWTPEYIANQMKELEESNKILGVKKTIYLDYPAAMLDTIPHKELNHSLTVAIEEVKPQLIFVNDGDDLHLDHRMMFESTLVATRPMYGYLKKILSYSTSEWGPAPSAFLAERIFRYLTDP